MSFYCPICHRFWKIREGRVYCDCGGSYPTKYFKDGIAFCYNPYHVYSIETNYGEVPTSSPKYESCGIIK